MATRKKLTKTRIKQFREALLEERQQLLSQVEDLDAEADVKRWRDAGFDDDPADSGSASFERETAQSLSRHARHLLTEIDDAVRRIDAGTFGDCESCGTAIDLERLDAIPYARLCLDCKRRDETGR
jgi:DnaK suppressor protein